MGEIMVNFNNDVILDFITNARRDQFAERQRRLARKRGLQPPHSYVISDAGMLYVTQRRRSGVMVNWTSAKAAMRKAAGLVTQ